MRAHSFYLLFRSSSELCEAEDEAGNDEDEQAADADMELPEAALCLTEGSSFTFTAPQRGIRKGGSGKKELLE